MAFFYIGFDYLFNRFLLVSVEIVLENVILEFVQFHY